VGVFQWVWGGQREATRARSTGVPLVIRPRRYTIPGCIRSHDEAEEPTRSHAHTERGTSLVMRGSDGSGAVYTVESRKVISRARPGSIFSPGRGMSLGAIIHSTTNIFINDNCIDPPHGAYRRHDQGVNPIFGERNIPCSWQGASERRVLSREREFFIDNLLFRIHSIIKMNLVDRPGAMGV